MAAAPTKQGRRVIDIRPGTPFDPAEIDPTERRARMMRRVRDDQVNGFIRDASLNAEQAQSLTAMIGDLNTSIDAAFNDLVVPAVGTRDPSQGEAARLAVLKVLGDAKTRFDSTLAGFGPAAVALARSQSFNLVSLLAPEQSEQLRSFVKRLGSPVRD